VTSEFERIWKEMVMACSRYYPGIYLEGLKKSTVKVASVPAKI
jgi:hypothetical protein